MTQRKNKKRKLGENDLRQNNKSNIYQQCEYNAYRMMKIYYARALGAVWNSVIRPSVCPMA